MHKLITLANLEKYNVNIQKVIDNKVPTKVSAFENDSNYVSLDAAQQMIDDALPSLEYCTNNDILRLFDASIPEEPENPGDYKPEDRFEPETPVDPEPDTPVDPEPDTPVEPETPIDPNRVIGRAYSNGDIVVTDTDLTDGRYILCYIDNDGNHIDNFNSIIGFDVDYVENYYPEDVLKDAVKDVYAEINNTVCINCGKCYDTTIGCKYNNIVILDGATLPSVVPTNVFSNTGVPGCLYTICQNECLSACPYDAINLQSTNSY